MRVHSPYFAAEVAFRLPRPLQGFTLGIEAGVVWSRLAAADGNGATANALVWVVPMLGKARYARDFGRVEASIFFGAGVSIAGSELDVAGAERVRSLQAVFAFSPGLGAAYWLGPGQIALDVGYWYSALSGAGVAGQVGGLNVVASYRFGL